MICIDLYVYIGDDLICLTCLNQIFQSPFFTKAAHIVYDCDQNYDKVFTAITQLESKFQSMSEVEVPRFGLGLKWSVPGAFAYTLSSYYNHFGSQLLFILLFTNRREITLPWSDRARECANRRESPSEGINHSANFVSVPVFPSVLTLLKWRREFLISLLSALSHLFHPAHRTIRFFSWLVSS